MLGCEGSIEEQKWSEAVEERLSPGQGLPKPEVLFRRIEDEEIKEELDKLAGMMKAVTKLFRKMNFQFKPLTWKILNRLEMQDRLCPKLRNGSITRKDTNAKQTQCLSGQDHVGITYVTVIQIIQKDSSQTKLRNTG